ncbi:MAG: hypothetical protein AAF871_03675 [Pseudomonadota bacterium]
MTGSNKILTVSYGTFSCTLEGFDDPVDTMRVMAEYFRDLAADDRYFGAEPPTPDADMLHRIAEREVRRRVEARVSGDNVVLRQVDTGLAEDEDDLEAAAHMPQPVPGDSFDAAAAPQSDAVDAEVLAPSRSSDVEDKLSRIRAVVRRTRTRDLAKAQIVGATDHDDADEEAIAADLAPGFGSDIDASLINQVMAEQAAEQSDNEPPADETTEPVEDDYSDNEIGWDDGSNAVETPEITANDDAEFEDVEDEDSVNSDIDADSETSQENAFEEEAAPGVYDGESIFAESHEDATEAGVDAEAQIDALTETAINRLIDLGENSAEDKSLPGDGSDSDGLPELTLEQDGSPSDGGEETEAATISRRADLNEEHDDDDDGEDDNDVDEELWDRNFDEEAAPTSRILDLSDEDTDAWDYDAASDTASPGAIRGERTISKSEQLKAPDEENDRLQMETESAFRDGSGTRRRSAIAHLRAAVAATRADKILSRVVGRDLAGDPDNQKDYREDLSRVVKPRRTTVERPSARDADIDAAPNGAADEPIVDENAPLMLVSELRIEGHGKPESGVDATGPSPVHGEGNDRDFVEYAAKMGVSELSDMMEAAAAYTTFVEGYENFSRPQIMRWVARLDPSITASREAGLRCFGQLLRQGRIEKLQRGQFRLAETSRFRPATRVAGE